LVEVYQFEELRGPGRAAINLSSPVLNNFAFIMVADLPDVVVCLRPPRQAASYFSISFLSWRCFMSKPDDKSSRKNQSESLPDSQNAGVTRRAFLKRAGAGAAGITAASVLDLSGAAQSEDRSRVLGPGTVPVTLKVNGKARQVNLEPRTTLAEALRTDLGLTGTKVVCDRGSCSACTVWIDKMPVCSCLTLALDAAPHQITTIEGLAKGEQLHPVQAAFIEHDALQCGFCTPGMIMSCAALVERNPNPTLEEVKIATSGNLCRCGTYPKVFDATLAAAKSRRA
jgi:xanthine dehydrogenase YagT iron-sulfur-binding subunit